MCPTWGASRVYQDSWNSAGCVLLFKTVGAHQITLLAETGDLPFTFQAISPDDVVSLELDRSDSGTRYTAYGITAEGNLVVNLLPEFTVAGEARDGSDLGYTLVDSDGPRDGTVQATWNGLTATR